MAVGSEESHNRCGRCSCVGKSTRRGAEGFTSGRGTRVWPFMDQCNAFCADTFFQEALTHATGKGNATLLREADVLLLIGAPLAGEVIPDHGGYVGTGARLIHIDSDPAELGFNFFADLALMGEVRGLVKNLFRALQRRQPASAAQLVKKRELAATAKKASKRRMHEERWSRRAESRVNHPYAMFHALEEFLDPMDLIWEEAMTTQPILRHVFALSDPELYYPALSLPLGAGLPGAVGAAIGRPDKRVIGISADGAAMYVPQALWTAAHERLNILFVIVNNGSYRVLKLNLIEFRKRLGEPEGYYPFMDVADPEIDFVHLASSMGVLARCASTPDEVAPALRELLNISGPKLLDMHVSGALEL
jgi:thiamine pyrophosphate-dependent acetolactate synthase large subunit-like protein